jgi:formylglycine-generating enzyme required for sulfatase activity
MKKLMLSFFTLLLFAAATTTTTAQEPTPKLAVLVVGMDDWMLADVLAHLVGEELKRSKNYDVVTRSNAVQNKLEALRRGYSSLADYLLCAWGANQGIAHLCLVTVTSGLNFSLRLLDVSSGEVLCSGSRVEPNAVSLKQLAWSLAGNLGSGCTPSGPWGDYEPLIDMEMVYVEGGTFTMGCVSGRDNRNGHSCEDSEKPSHTVSVGDFWIGKYEVTQAQWTAIMGTTIVQQHSKYVTVMKPGSYSTPTAVADYPMFCVSWNDAQMFCDMLSLRTGKSYRLATEAEWEYAARGGKLSRGYVYSGSNTIDSVAWYYSNSGSNGGNTYGKVHTVGTTKKQGNELGICDMSGNVSEWCAGYWYNDYDDDMPPVSSYSGEYRVIRGGGWNSYAEACRAASRDRTYSYHLDLYTGFRVV